MCGAGLGDSVYADPQCLAIDKLNPAGKTRLQPLRIFGVMIVWVRTLWDQNIWERIRIDRESEANHDLIQWLDKPVSLYIRKYLFSIWGDQRVYAVCTFLQASGIRAC